MQQSDFGRMAVLAAGVAAALSAGGAAAQPLPPPRPTNLPGVTTSAAPPAHFDALNASDAELGAYGFPPRPDPLRNPTAYARWSAAVGSAPERLVPQLQQTTIRHGPNIPGRLLQATTAATTSSNWSGYASTVAAVSFTKKSFASVAADFVVPAVVARSCNAAWEFSSSWVGIDGYDSDDVLQAGIELDAECASGTPTTYFSPWYEWYPNDETRITNLTAAAGQVFYVHVWATGATAGHAYLENLNANQSVSLNFSAPSGTQLLGNSAEWIIESPTVGGDLATLPTYGLSYFSGSSSTTGSANVRTPGSATSVAISLERSGTLYSSPGPLGAAGILFTSH